MKLFAIMMLSGLSLTALGQTPYFLESIPITDPRFGNALEKANQGQQEPMSQSDFVSRLQQGENYLIDLGDTKKKCVKCYGYGRVYVGGGGDADGKITCPDCNGARETIEKNLIQIAWSADTFNANTKALSKKSDQPQDVVVTGRTFTINEALSQKFSLDGKVIRLTIESKNHNSNPEEIAEGVYRAFVSGGGGYHYVWFKGEKALKGFELSRKTSRSSMNFYAKIHSKKAFPIELVGRRINGKNPYW